MQISPRVVGASCWPIVGYCSVISSFSVKVWWNKDFHQHFHSLLLWALKQWGKVMSYLLEVREVTPRPGDLLMLCDLRLR